MKINDAYGFRQNTGRMWILCTVNERHCLQRNTWMEACICRKPPEGTFCVTDADHIHSPQFSRLLDLIHTRFLLIECQKRCSAQTGHIQEVQIASPAVSESCVGAWGLGMDGWASCRLPGQAARGGNATPLLLSPGTKQVQLQQISSLASKLVACFARKVAQGSWCSVDEQVPHDGNAVILPRLGPYLEAAERYHAVHHLGHTEAVPEIMKGVVPVIVMNAQLQREGVKNSDTGELFFTKMWLHMRPNLPGGTVYRLYTSPMEPSIIFCQDRVTA